jgi:phosphoglycolate phosphatase-like HAD superfamily hydrolase
VPLCLVIFDCDGTLVDSQHAIVGAMTAGFVAEGLDSPSAALVRRIVGLPLSGAHCRAQRQADQCATRRACPGVRRHGVLKRIGERSSQRQWIAKDQVGANLCYGIVSDATVD